MSITCKGQIYNLVRPLLYTCVDKTQICTGDEGTYNLLCVLILYKLKIKVTPGTEGSWRYSSNLFAISALEGNGRLTPLPSRCTHGKDPEPIVQVTGKASCPSGRAWNMSSRPHGHSIPDRPARRETLSQLSYTGRFIS